MRSGSGKVMGVENIGCHRKTDFASSWHWFRKCDNCFCYCNEEDLSFTGYNSTAGKMFSLRDVTSDIDHNLYEVTNCEFFYLEFSIEFFFYRIVTGVGVIKVNDVIQLQILQQKLLPNGVLMNDGTNWTTSSPLNFTKYNAPVEDVDYVLVTWQNRSIALTSGVIKDNNHVVTGVRFRKEAGHVKLEIRATQFDFGTGILINLNKSFWTGNSNSLNELTTNKPDLPTRSVVKSQMFAESNQFIKFQPTDMDKDGAQTIVPYLDSTTVTAFVPLSGVGLYFKSSTGYGGFIAPKLITFDFGRIQKKWNRFWTGRA